MAPRLEPHEQFVDDTTLGAIFVSGEAGTQCGLQARWYLLRGYQVYNASTKKPLILRAVGWGADTKYNTYEVTYLAGYKPRTQEKPHSSTPFSLGNWKDVYTRQIKAIDHLIGELMRFGKQVTVRKWRWELNAIQVDKTQALQLEQKSELETLESAELTSREYLKNRKQSCQAAVISVALITM
jgi:hypothetical protein